MWCSGFLLSKPLRCIDWLKPSELSVFRHDKTRLMPSLLEFRLKMLVNRPRDTNFADADGHIAEGRWVGLQSCCIQLTTPVSVQNFEQNTYQNPLKIRGEHSDWYSTFVKWELKAWSLNQWTNVLLVALFLQKVATKTGSDLLKLDPLLWFFNKILMGI